MATSKGSRRVVVTGVGLVTAAANSAADTWKAVVSGRSAVSTISRFDVERYPTRIAAEIKQFDPTEFMDVKDSKRTDRMVHFAACATRQALGDVRFDDIDRSRVGVLIGSGIGGIETFEQQHATFLERGPGKVSPFFIPMMISDMASGYVSIAHQLRGPNYATVSACASGGNAIADAYLIIKAGLAEAMVTGGAEAAVTPMSLAGFCSLKALSRRNDEPERASRPFDRDRDGFVIGEGGGVLLLEELEHARRRGATVMAELVGIGMTGDAHHFTAPAPDGEGAVRAMRMALEVADMAPQDIDYINAHGTSTPLNDASETAAVKEVFGEHAYKLRMSSTKSMIGHLLGAAASVELIFCVLAIRDGVLPPTINHENPDPDCDLDCVPNRARPADIRVALSNAFGFGGHNVSLIVKRCEDA